MSKLSGRKKEIDTLIKATDSSRSELIYFELVSNQIVLDDLFENA